MRDEVMMDLVSRAMDDPEFRRRAREDLDGTLPAYGYDLTEEEMTAVREFQESVAGLSDEELEAELAGSGSSRRFAGG